MNNSWNQRTTAEEAARRAAGRRHYNSLRKFHADQRRQKLLQLVELRGYSLSGYGVVSALARTLGVHKSTVSRDIKILLEIAHSKKECPVCGKQLKHTT